MRLDFRLAMLALFFVALFGVAAWSRAQTAIVPYPVNPPVILAGPDVGFRMTGVSGDVPVGELVVRVKGEWKGVEFATRRRPLQ